MGIKIYEPEEIEIAAGKLADTADPETSFFLGPTSESDLVFAFANKLDALFYLKSYFENHLSTTEKIKISSQIKNIRQSLSDNNTPELSEIIQKNESLEIYAEGYWDDFVTASQPFWKQWVENSGDFFTQNQFWREDDDIESPDEMMNHGEDNSIQNLIFSEPPEDVYNPEFVDALFKIIPLA